MAHPFVHRHSDQNRAVNRLPPLAVRPAPDMVHWSAGARVDCRAEAQLLSRREPALACHACEARAHRGAHACRAVSRDRQSEVRREQFALPPSLSASAIRLPRKQRCRNERRDLRAGLHRAPSAFESTYHLRGLRLQAASRPLGSAYSRRLVA
eukprot:4692044-Prymnesium_polylepis.1